MERLKLMHEMPLARSILETALEAGRQKGARRISVIDLVIGDLTNLADDSVQFCFGLLSRGTPAEGASLRFTHMAATGRCQDCGTSMPCGTELVSRCSNCGGLQLRFSGGHECYVRSIEVGDEGAGAEEDSER